MCSLEENHCSIMNLPVPHLFVCQRTAQPVWPATPLSMLGAAASSDWVYSWVGLSRTSTWTGLADDTGMKHCYCVGDAGNDTKVMGDEQQR